MLLTNPSSNLQSLDAPEKPALHMETQRRAAGAAQPHTSASLGGLGHGLYQCGRETVPLLTVLSCKVFRLQATYGEHEICLRSPATDP